MDILFALLKQLANGMSAPEFIVVLAIIITASFMVVRFVLRHVLKTRQNGFLSLFTHVDHAFQEDVKQRLDKLMTAADAERLLNSLSERQRANDAQLLRQLEELDQKLSEISDLTKRFEYTFRELNEDLNDARVDNKADASTAQQSAQQLKLDVAKIIEQLNRLQLQLDNLDELIKQTVPEFRSYHKDIAKELGDLSKDVALVERTVNAQLNPSNAVKLR
jgi:DNA repair exonuclease SbcCD ATPase subunit